MVLADYADANGLAWPSVSDLADDCEMSKRSVIYALKDFKEQGYVSQIRSGNSRASSLYQLHISGDSVSEDQIAPTPESVSATVNTCKCNREHRTHIRGVTERSHTAGGGP